MKRFKGDAMLTLFLLLALETSVPVVDIDGICLGAAVASLPEDSARAKQGCRADESSARDILRRQWGAFPAAARDECSMTSGEQFSYVELLTCLQMQNVGKFERAPTGGDPVVKAAPEP
jgi:hypothetical protein